MTRTLVAAVLFASALVGASAAARSQSVEIDQHRAHAERLVAEGEALRLKQDAQSLRLSIDAFARSLPFWQAASDRAGEAASLHRLGTLYRSLGDTRDAREHLERALSIRRALGDDGLVSDTLSYLGAVYQTAGDVTAAVETWTEALVRARAARDPRREATALSGLGLLYDTWGELDQAANAYRDTLALARQTRDRRAEAVAMGNLGRLYQATSQAQQALDHFRQALAIFEEVNDRARQANTLHAIGAVYHSLGDTMKALDLYNDALRIARELGNRQLEASTLNTLAMTHSAAGAPRTALGLLDQALGLASAVDDPRLIGYTLHNLGDVHASLGQSQQALDHLRRALPFRRAARDRTGEAHALIALAAVSRQLGNAGEARASLADALVIARDVQDKPGEALALTVLARIDRDDGALADARAHLETALSLVESIRRGTAIQELRTSYAAASSPLHELYVDVLMRLHRSQPSAGFDGLALAASERGRARSLMELVVEGRADIRSDVDQALLAQERSLQQRLNAKAERQRSVSSDPATQAQALVAARELTALTTQLHEVEGRIRTSSPRYAAVAQPQPLALGALQRDVLDADSLLLEYSLGEERSFVWAVTSTAVGAFELPGRKEIEAVARRVYEGLTARQVAAGTSRGGARAGVRDSDARYAADARALSEMILGPVASRLGARRLLVVADGALRYIPFAALPRPSGSEHGIDGTGPRALTPDPRDPLIAHHEIVTLPSASVVALLRDDIATRTAAPKALAVLADPVFDAEDERVGGGKRRGSPRSGAARSTESRVPTDVLRSAGDVGALNPGGAIARLPFTRREAESILAGVAPQDRLRALDFHASRATLTGNLLRDYRVVHIATHALLNDDHPELSGLVLSLVDERGDAQDGFLRLHDIYNLRLPADLVVLSACQTGLGKDARGEGLVGLARGLMYAGASRVVSSLWKVDDAATAALMKRFYEGMFGPAKLSPAAALREAQVALWRQPRWRHPYYWAAWTLQGEWRSPSAADLTQGI